MKFIVTALALSVITGTGAAAQSAPKNARVVLEPNAGSGWKILNRSIARVVDSGRTVTRFDERAGAGFAWMPREQFGDGEIDVDVRGRDVAQKSFVGVAFHMTNDTTAEIVWLRPFNFRGVDSAHHAHAVQYTSYPEFSWEKLRNDRPGVFESAVPDAIKPSAWVHLRVSVHGTDVRVFLDHSETPVLAVKTQSKIRRGSVGLWVGDQSNGDFANLTITRGDSGV